MGRPTKYNPEYCLLVIKWMKKGHSKLFVAGKLGISRDTLYEWCRKYPEFSDTIKVGEMQSYAYWEEIGMKAMLGKMKGFRPSLWIFTMKARFGWRDNSPVKETEDMADVIDRETKQEKPQRTIAEIIEKYSEYKPVSVVS
jgi:hypothetical protein